MFEYDIDYKRLNLLTPGNHIRLNISSIQSLSSVSYEFSETAVQPVVPAFDKKSSNIDNDLAADIALSVTPKGQGTYQAAIVMLLNSVGANADKQDHFVAEVYLFASGVIKLGSVKESTVPVKILHSVSQSISLEDARHGSCVSSSNRYWCSLTNLAAGAESKARAFMNQLSESKLIKSGSQTQQQSLNSNFFASSQDQQSISSRRQRPHQRTSNNRNESAASLFNSMTHSLFSFTLPLLIGILTGSIVVLTCVWLSDLISCAIFRFRYGARKEYERFVVLNCHSSGDESNEKYERANSFDRLLPLDQA